MSSSWQDVLAQCLALAEPFGTERVSAAEGCGRVLAQDIAADRDYPGADLSQMDGYAVGPSNKDTLCVEGENTPGNGAGAPLTDGTARRIFTGAELPAGATRIVPQENVKRDGNTIRIETWPDGPFVRPRGREAKQGAVVLKRGTKLGPVELGVLATVGGVEADVIRLPCVGHLTTGDEIVSPDQPLPAGKIRDSNSALIDALLQSIGMRGAVHGRAPDDRAAVTDAVEELAAKNDIVLVSGGASVGDHDHARPALEAAGFKILAFGLHVKPGRPVAVARRAGKWAVALPGNPLSHLVIMRLLVLPLLRACAGETDVEPRLIRAVIAGGLKREVPTRDTFWPATLSLRNGQLLARPSRFLSSGDLLGTAGINGFIHLPSGQPVPGPEESAEVLPLASFP
jgi:molybdopterin molybdotransferase